MPDFVPPAHLWIPERKGSYGDEAADLWTLTGRSLDAEQRLAVDAILSYGQGGAWVALEAAIIEARQNGKTLAVIEPVVIADLFLFNADYISWTAHLFKTARKAFVDVVSLIDGCAELSRRVKKITFANGEEAVELTSGARLEFLARSKRGGRGLGGKRLVMDEALFLSAESMGALIPTLSARENPQILYGSSAGLATSDHLRALRDRGRKGGDPSLIWAEWCAPGGWADPPCKAGKGCTHIAGQAEGCALDDESLWPLANHCLGRRITYEFVRAERRALPLEEFGRERLGWFDLPAIEDKPIALGDWAALAVGLEERPAGTPCFFLDCSPELRSSSISAVAMNGGKPHLELADYGPGADWLPNRAKKLDEDYPGARFAVFASGAVSALLPDLKERGIEPETFTNADMGAACAHIQKSVADSAFTHSGDPLYATALEVAVKRDIGDDMWAWSRRRSGDISPIVSGTGALWLFEIQPAYDVLDSVY